MLNNPVAMVGYQLIDTFEVFVSLLQFTVLIHCDCMEKNDPKIFSSLLLCEEGKSNVSKSRLFCLFLSFTC